MTLPASQLIPGTPLLPRSTKLRPGAESPVRGALTASRRVLEVLRLSYFSDKHSYSHKMSCVRKAGLSHGDVPVMRKITPESSSHRWKSYVSMIRVAIVFPPPNIPASSMSGGWWRLQKVLSWNKECNNPSSFSHRREVPCNFCHRNCL